MAEPVEGASVGMQQGLEARKNAYSWLEAEASTNQPPHAKPTSPPQPSGQPALLEPAGQAAEEHPPAVGAPPGAVSWLAGPPADAATLEPNPDARVEPAPVEPAPLEPAPAPVEHAPTGPAYKPGEFRRELWTAYTKQIKPGTLPSIGGRKVNWALRTGVAVALSCVYATAREVEDAEWQSATVFSSVLAVAAVSGPSLGDTLHHAWELFLGSALGATMSVIINETARPMVDDSSTEPQEIAHYIRKIYSIVLFCLATFWALTRKQGIGFKRCSVGVMCVGVIKMSAIKNFSLEWYFPFTVLVPCTVGPLLAVVAMVFPFPSMATRELRNRLAFQAYLERALLGEQYEALCNRTVDAVTAADQLCETVRDNHTRMKELAHSAEWELIFFPRKAARLNRIVAHFGMHLSAFRSMQATLRKSTTKMSKTHSQFHSFTGQQWRDGFLSIAALTDEIVAAEQKHSKFNKETVDQAASARTALDKSFEHARTEIVFEGGSLYFEPKEMDDRVQEHCRRTTQHFFFHRLFLRMLEFCAEDEELGERPKKKPFSWSNKLRFWWELPSRLEIRQAIKKTVTVFILIMVSYIDVLREENPESIWNLIGCAFVFSDFAGSAFVTGMHRIIGTLLSGAFALFIYGVFHSDVEAHDAPSNRFVISLVLTLWTTAWSLGRTSPRYGYLVTVTAFSSAIMFVGALEGESGKHGDHHAEEVILFRMHQISLGAAVYVIVEMLMWPKSARRTMNRMQADILLNMKKGLHEAVGPYMSDEYTVPEGAAKHQHPPSVVKGKSLIGASYKGVVAAQDEPQRNRPPFQRAAFERVLRTEARIFRILGSLTHASRYIAKSEVPEEVHHHMRAYVTAADQVLDTVCERLKDVEPSGQWKVSKRDFVYDPAELVEDGLMGRVPQYWAYTVETSAPVLVLESQDAKLRAGMKEYYAKVASAKHLSNEVAYTAQSMFFCLMKFTQLMLELGERMRPIRSQEANPMHL